MQWSLTVAVERYASCRARFWCYSNRAKHGSSGYWSKHDEVSDDNRIEGPTT